MQIMVAAAKHVEKKCDAIDLNLGCPQRVAYTGKFGSYLLAEEHRETVLSIVKALVEVVYHLYLFIHAVITSLMKVVLHGEPERERALQYLFQY